MAKVVHVKTWDEFKHLATVHRPSTIAYTQQRAPLSSPPLGLRLIFVAGNMQYVFVDTAKCDVLRRTRIPIRVDKYGNFSIEEEDIEKFIRSQLERNDIEIQSFELMGGY